jgi:hypothetical protein
MPLQSIACRQIAARKPRIYVATPRITVQGLYININNTSTPLHQLRAASREQSLTAEPTGRQ